MIGSNDSPEALTTFLLRDGSVLLPHHHPSEQPGVALFTEVSARLQDSLSDEGFAVEMNLQKDGSLITLKVGEEDDEAPDFSPPEPKLL
ncbi:hypothetical protein BTW10_14005 [Chromohalobacter japonicus]|uniref:Uncharacterized protein n=1 Tax=Chromohalobacter japonicus TaxID=223900 RepID=A0A1Q8TA25_9GAMM|nr:MULTISPECIES: hypothetical protein [Chromohalobacter]OLO10468.1 hypothetical protein BTW10_14005 [Chromohalobacter japonicus]